MLVRIFVFVFVLFFSSLLIARTPKDIEEFRETTNLAKDVWKVVLPRLKKEINTKDDSIVTHKTTQLVEQLRKCPQIGDGGVVAMILVLYDGYFSFRTSEIIVSVHNAITPSNCLAIMGYSGGTLWQNGYSGGGTWVDNYTSVILPVIGKFTHKASIGMDIRWARYPYPMRYDTYYNQYQYRTAGKLGDVGLYDLAWRVLIEEAWYGKFDFRFEESDWYFHVANNAYRSGDKKLGWSFLFCAAIFDNAKYLDKVMSTAQLWLDVEAGQKKLPEQKILTGEERKKTFLEIVECYRGMNAHPRAWQLINEHKSEFDNHETLIKKVQNDWLTVIKRIPDAYREYLEEYVVYGVELYPTKNDPLSVKIPWPFPEGSIDKLKKQIKTLADKIKEDEKDGLINWYFTDGKLAVKAKYISCNDESVSLEKEDGKRTFIKIKNLWEGNKNYVNRRLAIRNMAIDDFCTITHKWNLSNKNLDNTTDKITNNITAKYVSIDQDNKITLALVDGTKKFINLTDLNKTEQEYIKIFESWQAAKREEDKKKLAELKKKLLSEVTFREWKSKDTFFKATAKFVSYNPTTKTVTFIKKDNEKITMELDDLCNEDKKYIHELLNPKLPKEN